MPTGLSKRTLRSASTPARVISLPREREKPRQFRRLVDEIAAAREMTRASEAGGRFRQPGALGPEPAPGLALLGQSRPRLVRALRRGGGGQRPARALPTPSPVLV